MCDKMFFCDDDNDWGWEIDGDSNSTVDCVGFIDRLISDADYRPMFRECTKSEDKYKYLDSESYWFETMAQVDYEYQLYEEEHRKHREMQSAINDRHKAVSERYAREAQAPSLGGQA